MDFLTLGNIELKQRSDLHLARKLWHVLGVLAIAGAHQWLPKDTAIKYLALVSFLFVAYDVLRLRIPALNRFAIRVFGPLMRSHEKDQFAGTTYLLVGTFIIELVYPKTVVSLALLFLALADPLASYVGIRYGKDKLIGTKSLQGSLAAFGVCTLISFSYFLYFGLMSERLLIVSLLSGLVGALSELLPFGELDDNFTFPVVSGTLLWVLFNLFGGL